MADLKSNIDICLANLTSIANIEGVIDSELIQRTFKKSCKILTGQVISSPQERSDIEQFNPTKEGDSDFEEVTTQDLMTTNILQSRDL